MLRSRLILNRYEPLGKAGSGGYGTVQVAWDPRIQRKVAIKTIELSETDALRADLPGAQGMAPAQPAQPASAGDSDATNIMPWENGVSPWRSRSSDDVHVLAKVPGLDEARTAAMLQDPRIVTVYDVEIRDKTAYLIMEYVEGITLTKLLRDYGDFLTLDIVAAVFDAIAGALRTAHKAHVLHLDIKPDNVLINTQGQVKVTDFGLATLADASGHGSAGGGTIGYMPLEQMRREPLSVRTDEWSLAAVLYEMLTGENPFWAPDLSQAESAIEDAELVLPSLCWDNLDEEMDDVVFYALAPDASGRYGSIRDFQEEADKFLGNAKRGAADLKIIVADALNLDDEEGESDDADERQDHAQDEGDGDNFEYVPAARDPLRERMTARTLSVLGRIFGAVASGLLALVAVHTAPLAVWWPQWGDLVGLIVPLACAILGAVRPHIGALLSFCLMGVAVIVAGAPVLGAVLIAATVVWWLAVGRAGMAEANSALALPLFGAFGANGFVPLEAGVVLRPRNAVATVAFAAVVGIVLGALGSGNLLGWNATGFWNHGSAMVEDRAVRIVTQPATWCIVASWMVAALIEAALCQHRGRAVSAVGVVLGAAVMIVGALGAAWFDSGMTQVNPTIGLIAPIVVSALAMVVVVIWIRPAEQLSTPKNGRHAPKDK